jgi:hypothetical protein
MGSPAPPPGPAPGPGPDPDPDPVNPLSWVGIMQAYHQRWDAPEVVESRHFSPASDVYSLGMKRVWCLSKPHGLPTKPHGATGLVLPRRNAVGGVLPRRHTVRGMYVSGNPASLATLAVAWAERLRC